jgi:hypothetical protein
MRFICFLIRTHMWFSAVRGGNWWLIRQSWLDAIEAQTDRVFEAEAE